MDAGKDITAKGDIGNALRAALEGWVDVDAPGALEFEDDPFDLFGFEHERGVAVSKLVTKIHQSGFKTSGTNLTTIMSNDPAVSFDMSNDQSLCVVKGKRYETVNYCRFFSRGYRGPMEVDMSVGDKVKEFKGIFSPTEISIFVGLLSVNEQQIFKENTGVNLELGFVSKHSVALTTLTMGELIVLFLEAMTVKRPEKPECDCMQIFLLAKATRPHKCILCGGLSVWDELMSDIPMDSIEFLTSVPFHYTPTGILIVEFNKNIYARRIKDTSDLFTFTNSLLKGWCDPVILKHKMAPIDFAPAPRTDYKIPQYVEPIFDDVETRIAVRFEVGVTAFAVNMGKLEKGFIYDHTLSELYIIPASVHVRPLLRDGVMYLDPDGASVYPIISESIGGGETGVEHFVPYHGRGSGFVYYEPPAYRTTMSFKERVLCLIGVEIPDVQKLTFGRYLLDKGQFILDSTFSRNAPVLISHGKIDCVSCGDSVLGMAGVGIGSHFDVQGRALTIQCLCKSCEKAVEMVGIGNFEGILDYCGLGHKIPSSNLIRCGNHYNLSSVEYKSLAKYGGDISVFGMSKNEVTKRYCARYVVKCILSCLDGDARSMNEKSAKRLCTILSVAILRKRKKWTEGEISSIHRMAPERVREALMDEVSMVCNYEDATKFKRPIELFVRFLVKGGDCSWRNFDQLGGTIPKLQWEGTERIFFSLIDWLFLSAG